jgi:predicted DNA-binding transcriptional regulator AlpA
VMSDKLLADYLTEEQLAGELGVCRETLKRWARIGAGPPKTKVGNAVYFFRPSVVEWLRSREHNRTSLVAIPRRISGALR